MIVVTFALRRISNKAKGKKQYYVKYDGYDEKFNEWINETNSERLRKRSKPPKRNK